MKMSEYRRKRENDGEIIDDTRRIYNLYNRPRFQKERDIRLATSDGMIGPGEVASLAHSVSRSILRALAVTSSPEYLSCQRRSGKQREVDLERSTQPVANVLVAYNPSFNPRY